MGEYLADKPATLAGYAFVFEQQVAWGDMDAMIHVNNTRYLRYCETTRINFFLAKTNMVGENMQPREDGRAVALAEVSCRYKVPVVFPDTLLVTLGIFDIGQTDFRMKHLLYSQKMQCVAAESTARMVCYNFKEQKRFEIDEEMHSVLSQYLAPAQ